MGKEYTKEDFENGTEPFEEVYKHHGDPFQEKRALERMSAIAKELKIVGFKKTYQAYVQSKKLMAEAESASSGNLTQFDDQEHEWDTGEWNADDSGVWKYGPLGMYEIACPHPILPVERLRNIDTGELKVRLQFRRGSGGNKTWSEVLADFDTISNAKNIVSLSRIGVSVTSGRRAQNLVDYITDILDRNYDHIPERKSVSRMGWNEDGFSPYVENVVFDGNPGFVKLFKSITQRGKFEIWRDEAINVRKQSVAGHIVLAAAFASALIEPVGILPFFVHLWGMDSGTGKTTAQMLAAAVWANPMVGGDFFRTFKGTGVGFEVLAGFLNSIPVVIDELQLAKDSRGKLIFNVYELAAGAGKLRSNRTLGIANTLSWSNCFITSGETPLVSDNDGAGAINRVIEIECKAEAKIIENGHRTSGIVKANYGHAGKMFIERLTEEGVIDEVKELYEKYYSECVKNNTTEKQAMAAAIIITADELVTRWIFEDSNALTVGDVAEFLKSRQAVSAAERGYGFLCDWVSQNSNRLRDNIDSGDVYGAIGQGNDSGWVFIIRSVFNRVCDENGFSARALLSHLRSNNLIQTSGRAFTRPKRVNGMPVHCVVLKINNDAMYEEIEGDGDELPF